MCKFETNKMINIVILTLMAKNNKKYWLKT